MGIVSLSGCLWLMIFSVNWDVEELEAKRKEIEEKNLLKIVPTV